MDIYRSMYEYALGNRTDKSIDVISFFGRRVSYGVFMRDVDKIADWLANEGVTPLDSVAICLPNFPSAIAAFYAVNKLGAAVNVIHPLMPPRGMYQILTEIKSKIVFVFDNFYNTYREVLNALDIKVVVCGAQEYMTPIIRPFMNVYMSAKGGYSKNVTRYSTLLRSNCPKTAQFASADGERTACYLHSGGTTGAPKTVVMSNRALNSCAFNIISLIGKNFQNGDAMLMVLPMFHVFGLGVCMHTVVSHNARCVLVPKFSPRRICKLIGSEKLAYMTGVPSMYEKLLKESGFKGKKLQNMKFCYCGGDKLKQDVIAEFDRVMNEFSSNCKLCEGYGLTEATVTNVNEPIYGASCSVGKPIGTCKAGVFDEVGNLLPCGERGEICVGGDSVMSGYYNDEKTTNKVIFKDQKGVRYVKTGDVGYMDEDGRIYFVDRKKRMLKISGINVFPSEIESVVYDMVEQVDKCCAIGISECGKTEVKLIVTLKDGAVMSQELEDKLRQEIGARLMKYSIPKIIEYRQSLPLTHIGKVDFKLIESGQ